MSKDNKGFFAAKSEWAKIKDELLADYLASYTAKILKTGRPLLFVDCFAGKGVFDDDNDGSPIIALKKFNEAIAHTKAKNPLIDAAFIEALYFSDLAHNITGYANGSNSLRASVIPGRYESAINPILRQHEGSNVFLYIDPYGIKALNMGVLCATKAQFPSVEFLLNLNSFGFVREGCRFCGVDLDDVEGLDEIMENEEEFEAYLHDETWRDVAAGGDYWVKIINDYKDGLIDGYGAEMRFTKEFCQQLKSSYRYVLNFPIRLKEGNRPKYRMIHGCNHPDGCILMYENMVNQKHALLAMQSHGQMSLFEESVENEFVDLDNVRQGLLNLINTLDEFTPLNNVLASFLVESGIICPLKTIREILCTFEQSGKIKMIRDPAKTKHGNKTSFMNVRAGQQIFVRGA